MKRKLRMTVSYDGTDYNGFQIQPKGRTIQGELETALRALTGEEVKVFGSGRTDAGVHAKGQVIHFETESSIPAEKWPLAVNTKLPPSIVVLAAEEARADFHARHSAVRKTYRYSIWNAPFPDVFMRNYSIHISQPLNLTAMKEAALHLMGTHEFRSFCSSRTGVSDHYRTIYRSVWEKEGPALHYYIEGNGFLYNMVRIIVGTLIEVGQGKRGAAEIRAVLEAKKRKAAGPTSPAHGLALWKVDYGDFA